MSDCREKDLRALSNEMRISLRAAAILLKQDRRQYQQCADCKAYCDCVRELGPAGGLGESQKGDASPATIANLRRQLTETMIRNEKLGQELEAQARGHTKAFNRINAQLQDERANRSAFKRGAAAYAGLMGMAVVLQARYYCRCDEWYRFCPVHDSCDRCQELLG